MRRFFDEGVINLRNSTVVLRDVSAVGYPEHENDGAGWAVIGGSHVTLPRGEAVALREAWEKQRAAIEEHVAREDEEMRAEMEEQNKRGRNAQEFHRNPVLWSLRLLFKHLPI